MDICKVLANINLVKKSAEMGVLTEEQNEELSKACIEALRALYTAGGLGVAITTYNKPDTDEEIYIYQQTPSPATRVWDKVNDEWVYEVANGTTC